MDHRFTLADQVEKLLLEKPVSEKGRARKLALEAIIDSYQRLALLKEDGWTHLRRQCTITTQAPYDTGTVTVASGVATLTGGTWPTWAGNGVMRIDNDRWQAIERMSATELRFDPNQQPPDQTDSAYTLSLGRYALPSDFGQIVRAYRQQGSVGIRIFGQREWSNQSSYPQTPGSPWGLLVAGVRGAQFQIELFPHPSTSEIIIIYYRSTMRPLRRSSPHDEGVVSASGRVVTGTDTAFPADAAGSIIRFSAVEDIKPTGRFGDNPYDQAYTVDRRTSATELILVESVETTIGDAVAYTLDDPIDIDPHAMQNCLSAMAKAEFFRLIGVPIQEQQIADSMAKAALRRAKEMDQRPQEESIELTTTNIIWPMPL